MDLRMVAARIFVSLSQGGMWYRMYHAVPMAEDWLITFVGHFPAGTPGLNPLMARDFRPKAASVVADLLGIRSLLSLRQGRPWTMQGRWWHQSAQLLLSNTIQNACVQLRRRGSGGPWRIANMRGPLGALCRLNDLSALRTAEPAKVVEYGAVHQELSFIASPLSDYAFCTVRTPGCLRPRLYAVYQSGPYDHIYFTGYLPPEQAPAIPWYASAAPTARAVTADLQEIARLRGISAPGGRFFKVDDRRSGRGTVSALLWRNPESPASPLAVVRTVKRCSMRYLPRGVMGPISALLQILDRPANSSPREVEQLWLYPVTNAGKTGSGSLLEARPA